MSERNGKRKTRWRAIGITIVALALVYGGFELGRRVAGYSVVASMSEIIELRRGNRELEKQNETLERRVATAEIGQRVDRQAQLDVQRMMGELQAETARQQQELQFYRGLAVRQFGGGSLRVQELRIQPEEVNRFRVLITLVQAAARDTVVNGTVTFRIEGNRKGAPAQLALAEIEPDKRRELPFSLRFFQQIEVSIELPAEFTPATLQVEYRQGKNAEPSRQAFQWRVEGDSETPVL